jgi:hypothetical protein
LLRRDLPEAVVGAPADWPRWRLLLPHVLAAAGHYERLIESVDGSGVGKGLAGQVSWLLD